MEQINVKITLLKTQIYNLIWQVYFEELKENPNIDTLNWLIRRIFKSASTLYVVQNTQWDDQEQMALAIDAKYLEYLYAFGRNLPKAVVKIEKLPTIANGSNNNDNK